MSDPPEGEAQRAIRSAQEALRLVRVSLPYVAGLAHQVRLRAEPRVGTAGVFASGILAINPTWFNALDRRAATFVLAHELMHLALQTHARAGHVDQGLFNTAHDYVINATLAETLGMLPPAGGLYLPWARDESAETMVEWLRWPYQAGTLAMESWSGPGSHAGAPASPIGEALRKAGMGLPEHVAGNDVLDDSLTQIWFPDLQPVEERRRAAEVQVAANRSVAMRRVSERLRDASRQLDLTQSESESSAVAALSGLYRPPWEQALQRWLEAVAPSQRSYGRPSRRGQIGGGGILPGRVRGGWTLHIVLDTSGSMADAWGRALGAIADFCEAAMVSAVHVVQCDTQVTSDELIDPEALREFRVSGFGWSDMTPAMEHLARDPEVEAVVVITDGAITYSRTTPPYDVLWTLTERDDSFQPGYGTIIVMDAFESMTDIPPPTIDMLSLELDEDH